MSIFSKFAKTIGKGVKGIGKGIGGVAKGTVSFASGAVKITGRLVVSPIKLTADIAKGRNVFQALKDTVKRDLTTIKDAGPYAMTVMSMVPGIGQGVTGAIGAGLALARGQKLTDAFIAGIKNAIPGGPAAQQAFETGVNLLKGQNIGDAALQAARNQLPDAARKAFDMGLAVAKGKNIQDAAVGLVLQNAQKLLPLGTGILGSVATSPVWKQAVVTISGVPGKFSKGIMAAQAVGKAASMVDKMIQTARAGIPGGAVGRLGFDVAMGLIAKGKGYVEKDIQAIRNQLPAGPARAAFDTAFNLHKGRLTTPAPRVMAPAAKVAFYATKGAIKNNAPAVMKKAVVAVTTKAIPTVAKQGVTLAIKHEQAVRAGVIKEGPPTPPKPAPGAPAVTSTARPAQELSEISWLEWIWQEIKHRTSRNQPKNIVTVKGELVA